ncbi:MAG: Spo0B domain-containing protein [Caulobacteraceae bacterium]
MKKGKDSRHCSLDINCKNCELIEAEKENSIDVLKAHLSEQRHDFFNLLQVLYGYTQLKKSDKVLEQIKIYCKKMENIGRVYNSKCIKLADLLYTKEKEAASVDMNFEVNVDMSFDPVVRMLENENILHAVDLLTSNFFYNLYEKGYRNSTVVYNLKEDTDSFNMEIYCKEMREGGMEPFPFEIGDEEIYWRKISRSIISLGNIAKYCRKSRLETNYTKGDSSFVLRIPKHT